MKIKDVVRGIEEKTYQNTREWMNGGAYRADGYNSLASAEVVVDKNRVMLELDWLSTGLPDGIVEQIANTIRTTIESGSIISLKES